MKLTSSAFDPQGIIPSRYTCEGKNINPPLAFSDIPAHAKSLVFIIEDPDVPKTLNPDGMWDHWVLFNLPPSLRKIEEHSPPLGVAGKTSWGKTQYGGPCPPDREHRYFFKLYALDQMLNLPAGASKAAVEKAMQGHILQEAHLIGRYEKGKGY